MRIFKSNAFEKFARKHKISDSLLINAINEIENGLIDADLGSGVIKQRLAKAHRGKSKGYRVIIIYKFKHISLFAYGFDKKDKENLTPAEENTFKALAKYFVAITNEQLNQSIEARELIEVPYEKKL